MINSMTGFGRAEYLDEHRKITIEMKSVNHRYLDINVKLPKNLNFFESQTRGLLKKHLERGKVDIFITYENLRVSETALTYNAELAKEYYEYFSKMEEELGIPNNVTTVTLGRCPDVLTMQEKKEDEDALQSILSDTFEQAVKALVETRAREGEQLQHDLLEKLESMKQYVAELEARSPEIVTEYKNRLQEKLHELLENVQIDESRIAMEVTLFADKICIDEELVRLKSHVAAMTENLKQPSAVGRKLDFLTQEMNREANTILSKSSDLIQTDIGIELKTLIEKIREQIQNIE